MRSLLAIAPLLALLAGCVAQGGAPAQLGPTGQIDGAVVDATLHPFSAQPVYIVQLGARDNTSPLGGFSFRNVPVGTYTVLTSRDGFRTAAAVVDVEKDEVTRLILQLLPLPEKLPYVETSKHDSTTVAVASPGDECQSCAWDVPMDKHPDEVRLQNHWAASPLGRDILGVEIKDDQGDLLFMGTMKPDQFISIAGADIPSDATQLHVRFLFDKQEFTARPNFQLTSLMSLYIGATHDQIFNV